MSKISEIDKNFKVETKLNKNDIRFYNARVEPFKIYGIYHEDGMFRRMPEEVAKTVSNGVHFLHANTAGGRVRFKTDSSYVAISVKHGEITRMDHFPLCGTAGFDLYADDVYVKTFRPPYDMVDGYENLMEIGEPRMREITINFPLYSEVRELYIGLAESAQLLEPSPYRNEKPVVYYGSSVTQGGCASRPGTSYQAFVSRALNLDYINLGFSGNAKAEDEMIDYIASLDMSAYVCDYDYNAPTYEHLEKTHEKMFLAVREKHPNMPILLLGMPKFTLIGEDKRRLDFIIKKTYENALARGDRNVYLIDGPTLMALCGNDGTVDNVHPTDFGFHSMAVAVTKVLKDLF